MRNRLLSLLALVLLLLGTQCRRAEATSGETNRADAASPAPAAEGKGRDAGKAAGPTDFTEADLDLYERGIAKEIELVKAAQQRAAKASTAQERGEAIQAQWETATIPGAAKAAGIPEDRYRHTREAVHEVLKTLDFQGKIDGPLSMDMSRADEETKAKLAKDPFDALTPSAAAALRARMPKLIPLWSEYINLTAVAG